MNRLLILLAFLGASSNLNAQENIKEELYSIMNEQEKAWNRGDIEGFMEAYWKSDSLAFKGKNGLQYGWQTTLDNYKKSYPDKAAMGTLIFENTNFVEEPDKIDPKAFVEGNWRLERIKDTLKGSYYLHWRKIEGDWKIIYDHSTSIE